MLLQRGFDLPYRSRRVGNIPIVTSSGISDFHDSAKVQGPGVVTGRYGTIGEVFFIQMDYWPLNTTLYVRDFKGNDPLFISFLLRTIDFASYSGKSGIPGVNRNDLHRVEVRIPPPAEQRIIAAALSDVDLLIDTLDSLIAKKRAIKLAAMQRLLSGRTRLPGFKSNWGTKRIGEFTECTAGGTPSTSTPAYWGGDNRWMSSGELNMKIVTEVEGRITDMGLHNSNAKMLPENCVLIGLAGQGKTRGTVVINRIPLSTNQSIAAVYPNPSFCSEYLYYNLDTRYDELRSMSKGDGGRGGLNLKIIRCIAVPFPELMEQRAIASVLFDMDAEIMALENHRDKIKSIKQGMAQALLTGRIRLATRGDDR